MIKYLHQSTVHAIRYVVLSGIVVLLSLIYKTIRIIDMKGHTVLEFVKTCLFAERDVIKYDNADTATILSLDCIVYMFNIHNV